MSIRTIIVDDERLARQGLRQMLNEIEGIEIIGEASNADEAIALVDQLKPTLLFLDIEMPNYSGFEIVTFFKDINFEIIFVTAYDQYAIRAFEVAAIDYLLKPIQIEKLKNALEKFKNGPVSQQIGRAHV